MVGLSRGVTLSRDAPEKWTQAPVRCERRLHTLPPTEMFTRARMLGVVILAAMLSIGAVVPTIGADWYASDADSYAALDRDLEEVRQALGISGMAAAVVSNQQLMLASGFGLADVEREIEADSHTPFGLASVTKPIASVLVMQLVADGLIDLDTLVSAYDVVLPEGEGVTVRHLLTHTSEGTPGAVHEYNGNRYGYLGGVIEGATGRTFSDLLGERVLLPLEMMDIAVNPFNAWAGVSEAGLEDFQRALGIGGRVRTSPVRPRGWLPGPCASRSSRSA